MSVLVDVQNLVKTFGDFTAVDGVSFQVKKGEVLGFLGPNGAGKTTTMRMIAGYLEADGGIISVCGKDIEKDPIAAQQRIGYLPEGAPLYPDMTPRMLLRFSCEAHGIKGKEINGRVEKACGLLQLEAVMDQAIDTLSKGFKRRVGMALAILHDPDVLILDEPTDGLDPNQKHEVRELIKSMAKEKAIIISTHILEEVEAVCTRAMIIAKGQVVADGTPEELLKRNQHHNAVSLILENAQKEDVLKQLADLPGVARIDTVSEDGEKLNLLVLPKDMDAPIIQDVSKLAMKKKWEIETIALQRAKLDDVFRDLTKQQPEQKKAA